MYIILNKITQNKTNFYLNIIVSTSKISLILFLAIYLIGNFNPYFEGNDSYSYALTAKYFSQGFFSYTNPLFVTGEEEFFPHDMLRINEGKDAVYAGPIGFFGLTSIAYILAGNYGFFYLGPILGIILLVVSERISTNLFGKYVGFLTLLFLSTNHLLFRSALNLQTENIFTICFLVACYFLIKFFRTNNNYYVLGVSTFFVVATLIRSNGIIYFPIELTLLLGFFIILQFKSKIPLSKINLNFIIFQKYQLINSRKLAKIFVLALIPWILFFVFYFSYHAYFFDDPLTNRVVLRQGVENTDVKLNSLLIINEKNYENVKQYSKYILPYQFPRIVDTSPTLFSNVNHSLGENWLGLFAFSSLSFFLFFSIWQKNNRLSMIIFSAMIFLTIWGFSSITTESRALKGVPGRYMFPAFSLYYMILGIMIVNFIKYSNFKKQIYFKIFTGFKIIFILILTIFFLSAFNFSPPIQAIYDNEFHIQNPIIFDERYPLDKEGLSSNDVLISVGFEAMDYGFIPFKSHIQNDTMSQKSLFLLKTTLTDGYDVYTMKKPYQSKDKIIYSSIANHSDFTIIDHSNSFCKVVLVSQIQKNTNKLTSDLNCLNFQ
jgi:hypothetical protein